ncbi:hypothetical protein HO133_007088 [Letharia lupina]|uniref:Heterokaryon incompatibility domain-containing protein n=1 Tax=Letharia lupina TaxID=560253 RepID=A0A8H6KY46_9LECA|nr:uncharacterized protein HO133_007088 [Letharia lupina]KAF6228975.1 hypothetical protein HO133_007088 [Letharia lupina]
MRKKVLEPAISKTFKEAMLVVKALGERYIWIDSLCIIQDSPNRSDWFEESTKMHAIYANAFCNISATGAVDGRDGCFFDRSPLLVRPLRIKIAGGEDLPPGTYLCVDCDIWSGNIDNAPLTRRAWVVQERLLSRRVIHFSQRQIFWECRERQTCEIFPHGVPPQLQQSHEAMFKGIDPDIEGARARERRGRVSHPELNVYELWNSIVEAYTQASLTMEDDKFVAIMGLAQRIQELLERRYFAGLWEKYLADQLLWSPARSRGMVKPQKYIAPSWSWASFVVPITSPCLIRDTTDDNTLIQIVDLDVQTINDHPLSQVTSGSLRLRGSLVRGRIWKEISDGGRLGELTTVKYDIYDNGKLEQVDYIPNLDVSDPPGSVYVLPVKSITYETNGGLRARGLLLQLTGQCIREFRRVGTFQVRDLRVQNAHTQYVPLVDGDPLSADDIWLDGFKLDGKTLDTLTIV